MRRPAFAAIGGYRSKLHKVRKVRSIAKAMTACPVPRREGDELVCRCGKRWAADETKPECR